MKDYYSFVNGSVESKKNRLIYQFGVLKHKIKISFDTLKSLVKREQINKIPQTFKYYKTQIKRERSSANYYLHLFSKKIFDNYCLLLVLDMQIFFELFKKNMARGKRVHPELLAGYLMDSLGIVEDQKNRLIDTIDDIIEDIEEVDVGDIETCKWGIPPIPRRKIVQRHWKGV
ncbi:MAG: hypothetical protein K8T10_11525 [Candidatus Eremiobacteraeota bacterium]|nr:hypothetical protein [Candidatus Eremiobacteraeota bacterium]